VHHHATNQHCLQITQSAEKAAAVWDLDNLQHGSFDKSLGRYRPQTGLDVAALSAALRSRAVIAGTVVRNKTFNKFSEAFWARHGFDVLAAHQNCDARAILTAIGYVEAGFRHLFLLTGDSDFLPCVVLMRACGVRVHIWCRRARSAANLLSAADSFRFIDDFVLRAPAIIHAA
jgi:NYN domain